MNWILTDAEAAGLRAVRNCVARAGRFPSVRELMKALGFASPRSAAWLLERLEAKGCVRRRKDGRLQLAPEPADDPGRALTVDVPVLGRASCGPLLAAVENAEGTLPVSTRLAPLPYRHFILRAHGDSMDRRGIKDGDLVLVRQQSLAQDGDVVVALIDDEATIKELHMTSEAVILKPVSSNRKHAPIILARDFRIQGVVVASFPDPARLKSGRRV